MSEDRAYEARVGHQISVFIENRPGSLGEVIDCLRENNINMLAISLSEGLDIGYLRITVDRLEEARRCLEEAQHLVLDREVVLLEVDDRPGGLAAAIDCWAKAGINVEYAYSANSPGPGKSMIVVRVKDPQAAIDALA